MQIRDATTVLDREQLRDITLNDENLMREILKALIDDTVRQIPLMESAIREGDSQKCARLAHYSKGACANVGAAAAAELLKTMEHQAVSREFGECRQSLSALIQQVDLLRSEALELNMVSLWFDQCD